MSQELLPLTPKKVNYLFSAGAFPFLNTLEPCLSLGSIFSMGGGKGGGTGGTEGDRVSVAIFFLRTTERPVGLGSVIAELPTNVGDDAFSFDTSTSSTTMGRTVAERGEGAREVDFFFGLGVFFSIAAPGADRLVDFVFFGSGVEGEDDSEEEAGEDLFFSSLEEAAVAAAIVTCFVNNLVSEALIFLSI